MKYRFSQKLSPWFVLLLFLTFSANLANSNTISQAVEPQQNDLRAPIRLFNGKDFTGWYTFIKGKGRNNDPNGVFTIHKKMVRISGEEYGCITTNDEFENYRLIVEFKWGNKTFEPRINKARDSGILLHSRGKDGGMGGVWMHSIECQIIEGGTGDFIVVGDGTSDFSLTCPVASEKQGNSYIFDPSGNSVTINKGRINWYGRDPDWKDVKGFRGASDIEKPVGKWNRIECIVKDNEIIIYLNKKLVNRSVDVQPRKGKIQIQSEGAEIFFRRIDLIPL